MRYRISQLKIDPWERAENALEELLEKAVLQQISSAQRKRQKSDPKKRRGEKEPVQITNLEIIRESIDARRKPDVKLVYTVDFDCEQELPFDRGGREVYQIPEVSDAASAQSRRPVIVGFGPCGIFAALILAEAGLRPLVIERGKAVPDRIRDVERFWAEAGAAGAGSESVLPDPESNVQFGEGGAGTFSDGKLTTGIKDIRIRKVLEEFVEAGADPEILYKQRPHIGTDQLRDIIPKIRKKIEDLGGEVRFSTRMDSLELVADHRGLAAVTAEVGDSDAAEVSASITAVVSNPEAESARIETDHLILAIGHSARDTFEMLYRTGFEMEQKPFSIGVRIEHPQEMINACQYGDPKLAEILGPADYKLSYRCMAEKDDAEKNCASNRTGDASASARGRGVYTFCMCPGGQVINASTEPGTSVTNGMSVSRRDSEWANSGLLVDVRTADFGDDHPLAGIAFQKKYEKLAWENRTGGGMARSAYGAFRAAAIDPVRQSLPAFASEAILEAMPVFGRKVKGFDSDEARLTAVETRSSSPVRVLRDQEMQAIGFRGVIPAGEGPGYAGGIMSAAVDGIKAAEQVIAGRNRDHK